MKKTTIRARQEPAFRAPRQNQYIQWEVAAIAPFRQLMVQNKLAALALTTLWERLLPGAGGIVVISRTTLCELLNCSLRSMERALHVLIKDGWVQRIRIGGAFALAINHRVVWVGPRDQMQHAVFQATVIASRTEQDEIALDPPKVIPIPFNLVSEEEAQFFDPQQDSQQPVDFIAGATDQDKPT